MPKLKKKKGGGKTLNWLVVALGTVFIAVVVVGFSWFYISSRASIVELDPESLCPLNGATAQTVILLDATDALSPLTRSEVLQKLEDVILETIKGERLEVRVLSPGKERTTTVARLCNPGDGKHLSHLNAAPELVKKQFQDGFAEPMKAAMAETLSATGANESPIMAAIQRIAVDDLTRKKAQEIPTKLIVISDLLENTSAFSIYRTGPDYGAFRSSPAASKYQTDLAGASVTLWMIRRENGTLQKPALISFWAQWITENRGEFVKAIALQG